MYAAVFMQVLRVYISVCIDVCTYVCMYVCMGRLCVYDRVCMSLYNIYVYTTRVCMKVEINICHMYVSV